MPSDGRCSTLKWIASSVSTELAVKDISLLDLEYEMIVKQSRCPKLSWQTLQLSLWNRNIDRSLDFAYCTLLSYGLGMGARITCLKMFILHLLWVPLGSLCSFWCGGVVGPKPFAARQHVLSTHCKAAIQTANIACLQIGGLCWYPSEDTHEITFGITLLLLPWLLLLPLGNNGVRVIICCIYNFGKH